MCFSFSFLTEIFFYFSTCPGIVTCDHVVTNSEPLGYSCPHDARLVLSGTMLHQKKTNTLFRRNTDNLCGFFSFFFQDMQMRNFVLFESWGVNVNRVLHKKKKKRKSGKKTLKTNKTFDRNSLCVY